MEGKNGPPRSQKWITNTFSCELTEGGSVNLWTPQGPVNEGHGEQPTSLFNTTIRGLVLEKPLLDARMFIETMLN